MTHVHEPVNWWDPATRTLSTRCACGESASGTAFEQGFSAGVHASLAALREAFFMNALDGMAAAMAVAGVLEVEEEEWTTLIRTAARCGT